MRRSADMALYGAGGASGAPGAPEKAIGTRSSRTGFGESILVQEGQP